MENVTLNDLYRELTYLHRKVDHLENLLIREEAATPADRTEFEEALAEYRAGKTTSYKDLKKR